MPRKMGKRGLFPAAFLPGAFLPIALSNVVLLAAAAGVVGLSPGSLSGLVAPGPDRMKPDRMKDVPNIVLWAWERPEDLEFLPPRKVGVAFLARTLYLRGDELLQYPRLQPLRLPPGAAPIAVVRIESDRAQPPELSEEQQLKAVSAIAEVAAMPGVASIQVDYDATVSERGFYRELLQDLRRRLPRSVGLSITALASWCLGDRWLSGLPIDEAVPMLFRMGPDRLPVLLHLKGGGDFREAACRNSIGISTDEPVRRLPAGRRLYVFHPRPWSPTAVEQVLKEAAQWQ